jgi:hypothetical protein
VTESLTSYADHLEAVVAPPSGSGGVATSEAGVEAGGGVRQSGGEGEDWYLAEFRDLLTPPKQSLSRHASPLTVVSEAVGADFLASEFALMDGAVREMRVCGSALRRVGGSLF